jgi:DNA mismatch repair ATPase MutS
MLSHITAIDRVARDLDAYGLRYLLATNSDSFKVQICETRKKQGTALSILRRNVSRDISPGSLRDKMLTHLESIEAMARDIYVRD